MDLLGIHEGLDYNCQNQIQQEKLTKDDNGETVEGAYQGDVNIHQIHYLIVPSFASYHLKDCQEGGT